MREDNDLRMKVLISTHEWSTRQIGANIDNIRQKVRCGSYVIYGAKC